MTDGVVGRLDVRPALDVPELLAEPVAAALAPLAALTPEQAARCAIAPRFPAPRSSTVWDARFSNTSPVA